MECLYKATEKTRADGEKTTEKILARNQNRTEQDIKIKATKTRQGLKARSTLLKVTANSVCVLKHVYVLRGFALNMSKKRVESSAGPLTPKKT